MIEARHLRKVYDGVEAVRDVSLAVMCGEVYGFLGPNGAGKTTTLKMLLGLARPSSGRARLLGRPPSDPAARRGVGFLPEHFRFPPWLQAREVLEVHAGLHGMAPADSRGQVARLLDRVGLAGREATPLEAFSKGMLQRLGLAQALLNDPRVVFLDEPTSGLDPLGRRLVRDLIRELKASGVAVFLNSHLLGEVEVVCDRVAIIDRGRVIRSGPPTALPGSGMEVEIEGAGLTGSILAKVADGFRWAEMGGNVLRVRLPDDKPAEAEIAKLVAALVAAGVRIHSVTPRHLGLEEIFVAAVGGRAPDQ